MLETVIFSEDCEFLSSLDLAGDGITSQTSHICLVDLSLVRIVFDNPVSDLESRIDQLYRVLRAFKDRFSSNLDKFVNVAEARGGFAGGDRIADTVRVDAGALALEIGDKIFIQRVGGEYLTLFHPMFVQNLADLLGKVSQVAAVKAYPIARSIIVVDPALPE